MVIYLFNICCLRTAYSKSKRWVKSFYLYAHQTLASKKKRPFIPGPFIHNNKGTMKDKANGKSNGIATIDQMETGIFIQWQQPNISVSLLLVRCAGRCWTTHYSDIFSSGVFLPRISNTEQFLKLWLALQPISRVSPLSCWISSSSRPVWIYPPPALLRFP